MSLSSLLAYVNSNCSCFIPNLLFERVVIDQSFADSTRSRNNDDNIDDDGSESNERVSGAEDLEYREED